MPHIFDCDDPAAFAALPPGQRACLLAWIGWAIAPGRLISRGSSYGMKHVYEQGSGIYVTNGQFKGAMWAAGYRPVDSGAQNWKFRCQWSALIRQVAAGWL